MSSSPVGLPSPERVHMTREDVSRLPGEELQGLAEIVFEESKTREKKSARSVKGLKARPMKRDRRRNGMPRMALNTKSPNGVELGKPAKPMHNTGEARHPRLLKRFISSANQQQIYR